MSLALTTAPLCLAGAQGSGGCGEAGAKCQVPAASTHRTSCSHTAPRYCWAELWHWGGRGGARHYALPVAQLMPGGITAVSGSAREPLPVPQFPPVVPPGIARLSVSLQVFVSRELPSEAQQVQTQLHRSCSEDFYTYHNVPWKIFIRKEVQIMGTLGDRLMPRSYRDKGVYTKPWSLSWKVFYPKDSINNPLLLDLIFRQVRHRAGPAAPRGPLEMGYSPVG